jgi:protein-S-isoprenylcysteine O-methyltransferase Ste14
MTVVWIATLFFTKRTVKKSGGWILRLIFYTVIVLFIYLQKNIPFLATSLWLKTPAIYISTDVITFIGLLLMLWARTTLGKNWSANIVIKEEHKLITSGPYKYIRHPIYSGLILMVLGVVLYIDTLGWLVFFIIFFFGARYKAQKEERLLESHFSNAYSEYKKHTKYLIPFVL